MNEVHRWSKARTVKKQHGKKSTTILLVFCQQNKLRISLVNNQQNVKSRSFSSNSKQHW